jgi:UrcA family protein
MRGFLLAGAAVLLTACSAHAQDYSYPNDSGRYDGRYDGRHHHDGYRNASYGDSNEVVTVEVPRHQERDSATGAPIENIALSEPVRFDDLDLATEEGAHVLRDRIRRTASQLCRRLGENYVSSSSDGSHCYRDAVDEAMEQADGAIADARADARDGDGGYDD